MKTFGHQIFLLFHQHQVVSSGSSTCFGVVPGGRYSSSATNHTFYKSTITTVHLLLHPWLVPSSGVTGIADLLLSPFCPVCCVVLFQPRLFCNFLGRLDHSCCPSNVFISDLIPCHSAHPSQHAHLISTVHTRTRKIVSSDFS